MICAGSQEGTLLEVDQNKAVESPRPKAIVYCRRGNEQTMQ